MITLGIDVGGTKLLASVLTESGSKTTRIQRPTGRNFTPDKLLRAIGEISADVRNEFGQLDSIGIGIPGLVCTQSGRVHSSVILKGWENVSLADEVYQTVGVPCAVDNDVNNAARAELMIRDASTQNFLFLTVGTGIGGAIVLQRKIWQGASGLAGEFGHMSVHLDGERCLCGRRGCIATIASGTAIEKQLKIEPGTLESKIAAGDSNALHAVEEAGEALGSAIASSMHLLNLELAVLGGGIAEIGETYLTAVERAARRESFPEFESICNFETAHTGYDAGMLGASFLAVERFGQPETFLPWRAVAA